MFTMALDGNCDLQSRPDSADISWHMTDIDHDKSMVVECFAGETNAFPAATCGDVLGVDRKSDFTAALAEQAATRSIDIIHVAFCGIGFLLTPISFHKAGSSSVIKTYREKGEAVEEICAGIVFLQGVLSE